MRKISQSHEMMAFSLPMRLPLGIREIDQGYVQEANTSKRYTRLMFISILLIHLPALTARMIGQLGVPMQGLFGGKWLVA